MPIYKNGKYGFRVVVSYTDDDGNHRQIVRCNEHTRTKKDAKVYEAQLLNDLKRGKTDNNDITFDELFSFYIVDKKNELRANSLRSIMASYKYHIKPYFAKKRIQKINKRDIINWKLEIDKKGINTTTKNTIFKRFNAIFNYGCKYYNIPENVVARVGIFKDKNNFKDDNIHYWTHDQFKDFQYHLRLECEFKDNLSQLRWWSIYCAFNILYYAGLRKGEMNALKWTDLVFINGVYYLDVSKSINQKVYPPEITAPKNKTSIRKVPVCDELLAILLEHKERCEQIEFFNESTFYICGTLRPIADTTLNEVKNMIVKRCDNLPQIRIHDFRHSYCSLLINGGLPLSVIASLLGHANTEITQKVYSHIYPSSNIQVLDYLNNLKH